MEELLKEIMASLKVRREGKLVECWDYEKKTYIKKRFPADRGIGTKAYTIRRIQLLEDKLKELKKDLNNGKYDFKG